MKMHQLASTIWIVKWRLRQKFRRYREAFAYAHNRLDMTIANDIIFNCQPAADWYPLETLCVDSCLQTARDVYWSDHPNLESLVQSAAPPSLASGKAPDTPPMPQRIGPSTSFQNTPRRAASP